MNIDALISFVREHECSFYRDRWGAHTTFNELPFVSRSDFVQTPLSQRRYKEGKTLVKITPSTQGPFFSEWSLDDVAQERFGIPSLRPMVYFQNTEETLEKALWCYEQGMVRLIGEPNSVASLFMAERFRIDSLICDPESLIRMMPHFQKMEEPLETISIVSDAFDLSGFQAYVSYARRIRLVVSLPETGAFAETEFSGTPEFIPHDDCIVEEIDGRFVLTKLRELVTPIIRYDTGISGALKR